MAAPPPVPELVCPKKGIVVFSGGSAANSLVDVFNEITSKRQTPLSYIIPISDNGGSSSELIRVFGGPGIGDIRSRLVRLIPETQPAISALLNHRLSKSRDVSYADWQDIVAGTSPLWTPINPAPRELFRSMLNHVNFEIMKRARPNSTFNFSSASVGNLFLTGARLFTGSFESAIHLLALLCGIDTDRVSVVPAINSNFSHHISAGLVDGTTITGQNAISHPSEPTAFLAGSQQSQTPFLISGTQTPSFLASHTSAGTPPTPDLDDGSHEDANLPGSLRELRKAEINFSKDPLAEEDLPSRIERVWYINPYGQEMSPAANPKAVSVIKNAEALIYSIGSLYTSIVPCMILRGVGEAIASAEGVRHKILILNGSNDRETGPKGNVMEASDFIAAIARAGEESRGWRAGVLSSGILPSGVPPREVWRKYVTNLIYLEGEGVPRVDKRLLAEAGVECVRCWARKGEDGGWRYDGNGLVGALEAILGRGERPGERSRRNTMER